MFSSISKHLVLILAIIVPLSGCAWKPRNNASRFHRTLPDGSCNCYTCQKCEGYVDTSCDDKAYEAESTPASSLNTESSTEPTTQPRSLYEVPPEEPVVSTEPFATLQQSMDEAPVIQEIQPMDSPSDKRLDVDEVSDSNDVGGGEFKPLETAAESVVTPEPAEAAKETAPVAIETPEVVAAPKTPETAIEKVEVPQPESTFKPGETFKPRKKKAIDSSWMNPDSLFDDEPSEFQPSKNDVATDSATPETPDTDPIDTFFGRDGFEPAKLPMPKVDTDGKVVLRANPVDRNVVYSPPAQSASSVAVPALQAGFKKNTDENWLREVTKPSAPQVAVAESIRPLPSYQTTNSANIVVEKPSQPEVDEQTQNMPPTEIAEIRTIPVKLRAIPLTEEMIRGKQVQAKIREHIPAPQAIPQLEQVTQQQTVELPESVELVPQSELNLPATTNLDLEFADQPQENPYYEHTARANDNNGPATPPWRLK